MNNFKLYCTALATTLLCGCDNPVIKNYESVFEDSVPMVAAIKTKCKESGGKFAIGGSYGTNGFTQEFSVIALCIPKEVINE